MAKAIILDNSEEEFSIPELSLVTDGKTIYLERSGAPVTCPHTTPAMQQNSITKEIRQTYMPCSSSCALFNIRTTDKGGGEIYIIKQMCGPTEHTFLELKKPLKISK